MATKTIKVVGVAHWAKVFESIRDRTGYQGAYEGHDGAYTIDLLMDPENEAKVTASGSAAQRRKDGTYKFKRKHQDVEWAGGEPKVVKADGTPWNTETDGIIIPNGSTVELELSVYDTRMRPGTRLESVKVLELAELEEKKETPPPSTPETEEEIPF